jgi:hypothetical protein
MNYIKTISFNQRVHHSEHGEGNVIGHFHPFARVAFDKYRHQGAAGVKEVHPRNLTLVRND